MDMDYEKINRLDNLIYQTSRSIRVLDHLTWPKDAEEKFLSGVKVGNPILPDYKPEVPDFTEEIKILDQAIKECNPDDPVEKFLMDTANSYLNAALMLESLGTKDFTKYSSIIYGRPDDGYQTQKITSIDAAKFLLKTTDKIMGNLFVPETVFDISAADFAKRIQPKLDEFFFNDIVDVVLDSKISAKAVAGSKNVKVAENSLFSQLDIDQLVNHEAFVHSATLLNGKKQENLKCLGLGAPRTTRTQEGLAVLSELATTSIDIMRLRRIALRVIAVQMALDGADFMDLYSYFHKAGQSEVESVRSAQRIFRGGDVNEGVVFTKDSVYLAGIFECQAFIRLAIWKNKPEYIYQMFAGRLTLGDVVRLSPLFREGWLKRPEYVPPWASDIRRVAAVIAYNVFATQVNIQGVEFQNFVDFEEKLRNREDTGALFPKTESDKPVDKHV